MKIKRLLSLILALVMLVSMVACGGAEESKAPESAAPESTAPESSKPAENNENLPGAGKTIAFVPKQLSNPYFVTIRDTIEEEATKLGFEFKCNAPDASIEVDKQISICEAFISEGVDVLILIANDATALASVVDQAAAKGIAVFLVDSGVDESGYISYIGTNNYEGGVLAAHWFGENIKGEIAIIDGFAGNQATTDRYNGFMDTIGQYPDVKVMTSDYGNCDMSTSMSVAENFLIAYPNLTAIWCDEDNMAQGAGQAVVAAGKSDSVKVVGFDGTPEGAQAIIDGTMTASFAQLPATMGRMAVEYAVKHLQGETVDRIIYTDCIPVTIENAENFLHWN